MGYRNCGSEGGFVGLLVDIIVGLFASLVGLTVGIGVSFSDDALPFVSVKANATAMATHVASINPNAAQSQLCCGIPHNSFSSTITATMDDDICR